MKDREEYLHQYCEGNQVRCSRLLPLDEWGTINENIADWIPDQRARYLVKKGSSRTETFVSYFEVLDIW